MCVMYVCYVCVLCMCVMAKAMVRGWVVRRVMRVVTHRDADVQGYARRGNGR